MPWDERSKADWIGMVLAPADSYRTQKAEVRLCGAAWQSFAKKHDLEFHQELDPGNFYEGSEAANVLFELGSLGFPVERVQSWTRGTWRGCELYGFHALEFNQRDLIRHCRFSAVRLAESSPHVVQDDAITHGAGKAAKWHPRLEEYEAVEVPSGERSRPWQRGRLARTRLGRAVGDAIDNVDLLKPSKRYLYGDDRVFTEAFLGAAQRRIGADVFKYGWAVKDAWVVAWYGDYDPADGHDRRASFMDFLPRLAATVQAAGSDGSAHGSRRSG